MRSAETREWLEALDHDAVPEPDPAFVARLEAQLRTMDQSPVAQPARTRRRARWLVAGAPLVALSATAAAAAMTFLPHDPKPNHVTATNPGVTAPLPDAEPETPPSTAPTTAPPAVVVPTTAPATVAPTPTTAVKKRSTAVGPASGPAGDSPATTAVTAPRTTETTVARPAPTTTVPPAPESMTLQCTTAMPSGSPVVRCAWGASTSSQFRWYRLWRESAGSPPAVVFQSDNRPTTNYYDTQVQAGSRYYYKVDVVDGSGNVIAQSSVVPASCC